MMVVLVNSMTCVCVCIVHVFTDIKIAYKFSQTLVQNRCYATAVIQREMEGEREMQRTDTTKILLLDIAGDAVHFSHRHTASTARARWVCVHVRVCLCASVCLKDIKHFCS